MKKKRQLVGFHSLAAALESASHSLDNERYHLKDASLMLDNVHLNVKRMVGP